MSNDGFAWMEEQRRIRPPKRRPAPVAGPARPRAHDDVEQLRARVDELEAALAVLAVLADGEAAWRRPPALPQRALEAVPRALPKLRSLLSKARSAALDRPRQWLLRARWQRPVESLSDRLRRGVHGLFAEALVGR